MEWLYILHLTLPLVRKNNMTLTSGLCGPVISCMNMHAICMDIWLFGGVRNKKVIWTKNSLSEHGDFFLIFLCLEEKITHLNIWKGLGIILDEPNNWLFG